MVGQHHRPDDHSYQIQLDHNTFKEQAKIIEQLQHDKQKLIFEFNEYKIQYNQKSLNLEGLLHQSRKDWLKQKIDFQQDQQTQILKEQFIESCIKVISLGSEVERLNLQLKQQDEQVRFWKQQVQVYEHQHNEILQNQHLEREIKILRSENEQLNKLVLLNQKAEKQQGRSRVKSQSLEMEIQNLRNNISDQQQTIISMSKDLEQYQKLKLQLEYRIRQLEQENKQTTSPQMHPLLKEKDDEIRNLQSINTDLENEYTTQIDELTLQIEYYEKMQLGIKDLETKHYTEKESLEDRVRSLNLKVESLESELIGINQDLRRTEGKLLERTKQLDHISKIHEQSISKEEYDVLKKNYEAVQNETFSLQQQIVSLTSNNRTIKQDNDRLTQLLQSKDYELEQYTALMDKRKHELEVSIQEVDLLRKENQKVQSHLQQLSSELKYKNEQFSLYEKDIEILQQQNDKYRHEVRQMENHIDQKNKDLNDKIQELDSIKNKYEDQFNQLQQSQNPATQSKRMSMRQSIIKRSSKISNTGFLPQQNQPSFQGNGSFSEDN